MNSGFLLVAHGSRRAASNEEIHQLSNAIQGLDKSLAIKVAFLQLVQPDISTQLHEFYQQGIRHIIVAPYFLAKGVHVEQDIPELVDDFLASHPDCQIQIKDHISQMPGWHQWVHQWLID